MSTLLDELDARLRTLPVATAPLRRLRREYSKRLARVEVGEVLALAEGLLERGGIGRRFVAYELVHHLAAHRDALAPRVVREVRNKLATGLKNPRRHRRRSPA